MCIYIYSCTPSMPPVLYSMTNYTRARGRILLRGFTRSGKHPIKSRASATLHAHEENRETSIRVRQA